MTAPTITYGHGFFNDSWSNLTTGWTEHENGNVGTYTVSVNDFAQLHITSSADAREYYVDNNDALSLSSTLYTKILWRYRTVGPKAKIVAVFATGNQTVLALTAGGTSGWTYGSATLDTDKGVLNKIRLHADYATGDVYYDFIVICKAIFTISQYDKIHYSMQNRYSNTEIPSRVGRRKAWMGADETIVLIDGPIDDQRDAWKRTGDVIGAEVFNDIHHRAYTEPWQWFTCDRGQFKVVLENFDCDEEGVLPFKFAYHVALSEYRLSKAQSETLQERLGLV